MFRSKRDVDKHVADLDEKIPSEKERSLKYFTVARLYFNIGEEGLALKYLDKYCNVRPSSAQAFKFRGQVLEKASERESEDEGLYSKKTAAVEAYKASYHLDLSQKELLKKICEITVQLPIHDTEHARYMCYVLRSYSLLAYFSFLPLFPFLPFPLFHFLPFYLF